MNGLEYLEEPLKNLQLGDPMGMEEIDGIYKLGGRYEPGPTPEEGMVEVNYHVRIMPGSPFVDDSSKRNTAFTFELNSGQVVEGFNRAVKTLGIADKALFAVPPHLAYGEKGKLGIVPPNTWLLYNIELVRVFKPANTLKLMIDDSKKVKDEGNKLFKLNDVSRALSTYTVAIEKLKSLETESQQQKDEVNDTLIACHSNMAAAYIKLKQWDNAIKSCNNVFELDSTHAKASYRIGHAYIVKGEFELGIGIVKKALEKHPNDPMLLQTFSKLQEKQAAETARQKKAYAKMFN